MWFKKSALETDEYKTLIKRLVDLDARVLALETANSVFRDKVLRKVQKARDDEPEEQQQGGILKWASSAAPSSPSKGKKND